MNEGDLLRLLRATRYDNNTLSEVSTHFENLPYDIEIIELRTFQTGCATINGHTDRRWNGISFI